WSTNVCSTHLAIQPTLMQFVLGFERGDAGQQTLFDRRAVRLRGSRQKGIIRQIARQAYPAADDDVRLRTDTSQPFSARNCEIAKFHLLLCKPPGRRAERILSYTPHLSKRILVPRA